MKQRIILSEKQRGQGDTSGEHELRRSKRFVDTEAFGVAQQDGENRPGTTNREFDFQRPFYAKDGLPQHALPFSPSTYRPERPRSKPGIRRHDETIPSFADYRERERAYVRKLGPSDANVDSGYTLSYRQRLPREQKNNSFCVNRSFETVCSSKGRCILQILCIISLIVIALYFTTTNRGVSKGSRGILYDALPWVFRATNISAQRTRSKALWENHIVLSDDNRILIPESFESRWNVEVAPLFENQLHRIWDQLPLIHCSNSERVYAGFSMKDSESLPATVSYESKCAHDPLPQTCTQEREVTDLRHLSIDLPSKSSRASYSVKIIMKRSVRATDVTIDPDAVAAVAKGIVQFHLSDSSKVSLVRYCSDRRHHFSDSFVPRYSASSTVGVISLYELKRLYALTSKNRRGASYFTELWDADELSRVTFDPIEHSWHPLTRTNWKRFRLRRQDSLDEQNDKPLDSSSLETESVTIDGEAGSNSSESEFTTERINLVSSRIPGTSKNALSLNKSSSLGHMNENNPNDYSKNPSPHEEDKSESKSFDTASEPKTEGSDEQKEAQDEDDVVPDNLQEVEESEEEDESSSEHQIQDESGERLGEAPLLQNEHFHDSGPESSNSGMMNSGIGNTPPSGYVAPRQGDSETSLATGNTVTMNQPSASAFYPQTATQATGTTYQERKLPNQGHTSEFGHDRPLSQSPPSRVRSPEMDHNPSQPKQFPRQIEPTFPRTTQSSTSSPPTGLPGGEVRIQHEQYQATRNPHRQQTLQHTNANGLPPQGAPLHLGNTQPPPESLQSTQILPRDSTPVRADGSKLPPQATPIRIRSRETQQKGSPSSFTSPYNPQTRQMEAPLQRSSFRTRVGKVQQQAHSSEDAPVRVPILPRAYHVARWGVKNELANRRDFQLPVRSRSAFNEMHDSKTATEPRASASTTQQQPNGVQEALGDRHTPSAVNTPRLPQSNSIERLTRNSESTLIKTSTPQGRYT